MNCGFYLYPGTSFEFSGVDKKIDAQIKILLRLCKTYKIVLEKEQTNVLKSIIWRAPFGSWGLDYLRAIDEIKEKCANKHVEFFYIRAQALDRKYISFLKRLRSDYPFAKIILEIPTYPYDRELLKNRTMWPWFFKDHFYRRRIKQYVNRVATFSEDDMIYGIPTLKIMNGMDVESIPIAKSVTENGLINIVGVAMMQPYHGFERLITGLSTYYKNGGGRNINVKFVGYGPELTRYQRLVEELDLADRVSFLGKLQGEQLDNAYDGCDLAIGSMAGYKIGIEVFSSIKLGEYLAKGLPVITGARTLVFDRHGHDYNLEFPNEPSEIDISKIVEFYDKIYQGEDKQIVREKIRNFAMKNIDISVTLKNVIDYLET